MRSLCAISCFVVGAQVGLAASANEIDWNAEQPLTWDDFDGPVPRGADEARVASTTSSIAWSYEYEIRWSGEKCDFSIVRLDSVARFHRDSSWVRRGHRTPEVLEHEQGHFDIAQLYDEKFRETTRKLVGSSQECVGQSQRRATRNAERQIARLVGAIYDEVWRQYELRQEAYDRETNHGIDREAQADWTQEIAGSLRSAGSR